MGEHRQIAIAGCTCHTQAEIVGPLGVHRRIQGLGYTVTWVGTGGSFRHFMEKHDAMAYAVQIADRVKEIERQLIALKREPLKVEVSDG